MKRLFVSHLKLFLQRIVFVDFFHCIPWESLSGWQRHDDRIDSTFIVVYDAKLELVSTESSSVYEHIFCTELRIHQLLNKCLIADDCASNELCAFLSQKVYLQEFLLGINSIRRSELQIEHFFYEKREKKFIIKSIECKGFDEKNTLNIKGRNFTWRNQ